MRNAEGYQSVLFYLQYGRRRCPRLWRIYRESSGGGKGGREVALLNYLNSRKYIYFPLTLKTDGEIISLEAYDLLLANVPN